MSSKPSGEELHDHHDHHHHHHHHASGNIRTAFFLNLGFTVVEIVGGILTGSTAILADAVHDLGDSIALGQAWYFEKISDASSSSRYSYGYKRFSLLGALISTVVLLTSSLFVLSRAIPRIFEPHHPDAGGMIILAIAGVAVNGLAMARLSKEKGMNARVVALHLLEDVLGWVAVLVVAVILLFWDVPVLDPILAILITLYILGGVIKNLRAMVPVFLQAVPDEQDLEAITREIEELQHIHAVHHAHIWSLDGVHTVFTAHLEVATMLDAESYIQLKERIRTLVERHGLYHSTVEVEYPGEACRNTLTGSH
ncbi:cation diffusion facilitator family transporter [Chlorobium sp. KB01]|uniref:cation diffusion facilitator family transporter n=1 Tax=Chlorobium sp. KB01 TaxID=1917528 RepID=UPI000978555E|nr:cation diffusion facilitator family transporter [Chlorobium sp. KB01]